MIELTEAQSRVLRNGEPVRLPVSDLGEEVVLLRGEDFARIQMLLEDDREKSAWAALGRKAASRWAQENPLDDHFASLPHLCLQKSITIW